MSEKNYGVSVDFGNGPTSYSDAYQNGELTAQKWKEVLAKAHRLGADIRCRCLGSGTRKLAVRHRSLSGSYYLSRYPQTGSHHASDCQHYSLDSDKSGLGAYSSGVVVETPEGLTIKLKLSLAKKDPPNKPADGVVNSTGKNGKKMQSAMTLGGLLQLLWTEAGYNRWGPDAGKRWIGPGHGRLQKAANRIQVSKQPLSDSLIVAAVGGSNAPEGQANRQKAINAINDSRRLIAIAPLAEYSLATEQAMSSFFQLWRPAGFPDYLNTDADLWRKISNSYSTELTAWRSGSEVIAILQLDRPFIGKTSKKMGANVLNVALMWVSKDAWIPVASSYELKIENELRSQNRQFIKPLRFDAKEQLVFPDFWLTDVTSGNVPMEVFGMATSQYLRRKAEKVAYYDRECGPGKWWYWDAHSDPEGKAIPPFPGAVAS